MRLSAISSRGCTAPATQPIFLAKHFFPPKNNFRPQARFSPQAYVLPKPYFLAKNTFCSKHLFHPQTRFPPKSILLFSSQTPESSKPRSSSQNHLFLPSPRFLQNSISCRTHFLQIPTFLPPPQKTHFLQSLFSFPKYFPPKSQCPPPPTKNPHKTLLSPKTQPLVVYIYKPT